MTYTPTPRLRGCVDAWPDCEEGEYHPSCCRFPKSCSCTVYDPERVRPEDLEDMPKLSGSHFPGPAAPDGTREHPAASETPRDAREVERQDRWFAILARARRKAWWEESSIDDAVCTAAINLADREHADLVKRAEDAEADCDRWQRVAEGATRAVGLAEAETLVARAARDALQRDLAQAVSERDRLRAGIEALADTLWRDTPCGCGHRSDLHELESGICTGGLALCRCNRSFVSIGQERLHALLATPDADAQDEAPNV